jgi:hypothetical protein
MTRDRVGVGRSVEVAMPLEGQYRDCVGALFLRIVGISRESIPQGLKPLFLWCCLGRAKPEGLAYLEAVRAFA